MDGAGPVVPDPPVSGSVVAPVDVPAPPLASLLAEPPVCSSPLTLLVLSVCAPVLVSPVLVSPMLVEVSVEPVEPNVSYLSRIAWSSSTPQPSDAMARDNSRMRPGWVGIVMSSRRPGHGCSKQIRLAPAPQIVWTA